jgi:PAS domain S-box-containing protein
MLTLKENINYYKNNKRMKEGPEILRLDFIRVNGTILQTEAKMIFIYNSKGKPEGIVGIIKDVNEKKITGENEDKYSKLFVDSADATLLFDLEGNIIDVNQKSMEIMGYSESEIKSLSISHIHPPEGLDISRETFEKVKDYEFITFECFLKKKSGETFPAEVSSKLLEIDGKKIIQSIVRDISERKVAEEELKKIFERLRESVESTVLTIAEIVEKRDPYTAGHQKRVTQLACAIAKEMGLEGERINGLRIASMVHDVGKLYISADTLAKPRKLTDVELALVKIHPKVGYDILKPVEFPWPVADIVLQHHELLDGSGYPEGLKSQDIILEAKILGVADTVEAMSAPRPYRHEADLKLALDEISKNRNKLYDPVVVDTCIKICKEKKFNF